MPATKDTSAELMSAYLDAELAAEDAAAFEDQLSRDPEAASELEQLRKVVSLVASLPPVEAPPDFYEKVSKRIRRRQLFAADNGALALISLPFQVLSIIVILTVAALYMMAQLEQRPTAPGLEREVVPATAPGGKDGEAPPSGPAPVQP
ncbi:MAG: hypothetical protein AB1Z98_31300 [Nannocystaceae bacterium]